MTLAALAGWIAYAAVALAVGLAVPRLAGGGSAEWIGIAAGLITLLIGGLLQEIFARRAESKHFAARLSELANMVARLRGDLRDFAVGRSPGEAPAQDLATLTAEMKIMKSLVAQLSAQTRSAAGDRPPERPGARPALSALSRPMRDPTEPFIGAPGSHPRERESGPGFGTPKPRPPTGPIAPQARPAEAAAADSPVLLSQDERFAAMLRDALGNDRVDLYLEPVVELPRRRLAHQQCRAWIRDADGTLHPPESYWTAAERAGLLGTIDNRLLMRIVPLVRRLRRQRNQTASFFCGISAATLGDRELFTDFYGFMDENRDLNQHIVFEIRQYDFYHLDKRTSAELDNLSKAGFRFALGDVANLDLFVTDLSNRGFRYIKVAGETLLQKLARDGDPRVLKRALDRGAIDLVATGVGSDERLFELLDYGIDFAQGLVFGEPRPEELA